MKLLILVLIAFPVLLLSQNNLYPGMSIKEFRKEMPDIIPERLSYNETLEFAETINKLEVKYIITFNNNIITDISLKTNPYYLSWPLDTNTSNYNKEKKQSEIDAIIIFEYYKEKYGHPDKEKSNKLVIDSKKPNYSEIIKTAEWYFKDMKIVFEYLFEGDNHETFAANNSELKMYSFNIKVTFYNTNQGNKIHNEKYFLGMDISEFAKKTPELFPFGNTETGNYSHSEKIYDLDGEWNYKFVNDSLEYFGYSYYMSNMDELNEKNFYKCLYSTEKIISDYKKTYGDPTEIEKGEKTFKDPFKDQHWGYDVIEAKWKNKNMKFIVEFDFVGGKANYFFVVNISYFKPDYEYFD